MTLVAAVGDMNSGNSPIRFETRISTANVIMTGKYCKPCGPTMSGEHAAHRQHADFQRLLAGAWFVF